MPKELEMQDSMSGLSDNLVKSISDLLPSLKTEEDLRIGFEKLLEPLLKSLGIDTKPKYESLSAEAKTVYRGRPDAVHGKIIIEYEAPGSFNSTTKMDHAFNQLVGYISAEAGKDINNTNGLLKRFVGIGFDGYKIFFVQFSTKQYEKTKKLDSSSFRCLGPFVFDMESSRTLLIYFRALSRLPLTAENLSEKFGPKSKIAPMAVSALVDGFMNWSNERVKVFFNEWKRLFGIIYGEQFRFQKEEESLNFYKLYTVEKETGIQVLLFCIHTYFAFLMKLIAAELILLKEGAFVSSISFKLSHAAEVEFNNILEEIETGGIYEKRGITNFLEGDFFQWYLEILSPRLNESIREISRALSEFEPATSLIDPESTRDLLKKLYQFLVPQEVRHNLGEYYTPDWLAELVIEEVGYAGDSHKRILDPACGSGTFLVEIIQKTKEYAKIHKEKPLEVLKKILANVWGFDLNPLAVIAARTNYLFALGDLINKLPSIELPVYLADSILWPGRIGQLSLSSQDEYVEIYTSLQTFHVPKIWIKDKGFLLKTASRLIEKMIKENYNLTEAMKLLKREGLVFPPHERIVEEFYKVLQTLEKEGKNGLWIKFLKNAFAPIISGKFDFVIGNPPWIRWGYLSDEYRAATLSLWKDYGLFSLKGHAARLGGGEKDFSMLFTYVASDFYLKEDGKLGFLITQEVFKSKGGGEGFRRFALGNHSYLKVIKAHDLVSVQPFEGAANKTAIIILQKGKKTEYPVQYILWKRKKGVGKIPTGLKLDDAIKLLEKTKLLANPIQNVTGSWQTISKNQKKLVLIRGENKYIAKLGARVEPYGVFWLEIIQVLSNGDLIIRNLPELGKRKINQIQERIESKLVYPAIRGSDLERWYANPKIYVVISQDPKKREPFPQEKMKNDWPRTFGYLTRFKNILLSRGSTTVRELAERTEFYAMFGIGTYTFSRFKVVWKRMANDIASSVISEFKTPYGYKKLIPTDTTSFFPTNDEIEAHYLCAIINSNPVREFIKSYSSAGRGFGTPSVMEHVGIPEFNSRNKTHLKLAQLSETLHQLKFSGNLTELDKFEKKVDSSVSKLFSLNG